MTVVRKAITLICAAALTACATAQSDTTSASLSTDQVKEKLGRSYHSMSADEVRTSAIPGVYEVDVGSHVLYYAPNQDLLLFGEMYGTDGKSVTQQRVAEIQGAKAKSINTSGAVAVGTGPVDVVAFVNPDCHYCQKAADWFSAHPDLQSRITEHVFFLPMQSGSDAYARAENFICSPPALRQAAYDQIWRKTPANQSQTLLHCDGAAEKLALEAKEAARMGVQGTPTYVVNGQVVGGFNPDRLVALLNNQEKTE